MLLHAGAASPVANSERRGGLLWVKFRPRAESELGPLILQHRTRGECISLSASCCHWHKCGAIPSTDQYGRGFGTHRRRRGSWRSFKVAISNGCTFVPPAIRGLDGSKCS